MEVGVVDVSMGLDVIIYLIVCCDYVGSMMLEFLFDMVLVSLYLLMYDCNRDIKWCIEVVMVVIIFE